jgi:hypothetical protein
MAACTRYKGGKSDPVVEQRATELAAHRENSNDLMITHRVLSSGDVFQNNINVVW